MKSLEVIWGIIRKLITAISLGKGGKIINKTIVMGEFS